MSTVRHKVMKEALPDRKQHKGKLIIEKYPKETYFSRTKILDIVEEITQTVNLAEADIIVSGGRGLQNAENLKLSKI